MDMTTFEDELLMDAEDDRQAVAFIQNYLPQDLKDKFTEEELYYFLDVLVDYYANSGILDSEPDEEGYVDLDIDEIAEYMVKQSKKDQMGEYEAEDLRWIVEGEMEYVESLEE
jgi:hypothetical protein